MSEIKFKGHVKFKTFGKCSSMQKRLGSEETDLLQQRTDYKDYVNEIFAGLMWLG